MVGSPGSELVYCIFRLRPTPCLFRAIFLRTILASLQYDVVHLGAIPLAFWLVSTVVVSLVVAVGLQLLGHPARCCPS